MGRAWRHGTFLREQNTALEPLVRRYEGKFTVEFKSGVTVEVKE
jgi:hypothetical protein